MGNTGNREGWALGKPMRISNSGKEKELLRR
jgi:hypothetical protein